MPAVGHKTNMSRKKACVPRLDSVGTGTGTRPDALPHARLPHPFPISATNAAMRSQASASLASATAKVMRTSPLALGPQGLAANVYAGLLAARKVPE